MALDFNSEDFDLELDFRIKDNKVYLSFIPINFLELEELIGDVKIKKINRINIGLFEGDKCEYMDITNYKKYFNKTDTIKDIVHYFKDKKDEEFSIYKLDIISDKLSVFYDDDALLLIEGSISSIKDYEYFHQLYVKLYNIYRAYWK